MSRRKIDMTGVICKNWEVIEETLPPKRFKNTSNLVWWNCKCLKCGRIKPFNGAEIRRNRIGECHCDYSYNKKRYEESRRKSNPKFYKEVLRDVEGNIIHKNPIVNETGNTYGLLTVIDFAYVKDGLAYWNCKCRCGNTKIVSGNNLRTGSIISCGCAYSYKETVIRDILTQHNINFKKEYSFDDLKDKGKLRFDFAIFQDKKLLGLIEYQGEQHFELPNEFNHYGILQIHDKMKYEYCQKNNIPLLLLDKNSNLEKDILQWIDNLES